MAVAMRGNLVPFGSDTLYQFRVFLGDQSLNEKGAMYAKLGQNIEQVMRVMQRSFRDGHVMVQGGLLPVFDIYR